MLVPEALEPEGDEVHVIAAERETAHVMWKRFGCAVHTTKRVPFVDVGHRPLGREAERNLVGCESPREIAPRAEHDRIVQMRLRAPWGRFACRVPKHEVVRVVERVPTS